MPKSKAQKKEILSIIEDKLAKSKSVVFSSDNGLVVKTVEKMRREMKDNGAEYLVAKKTLLKKAMKDLGAGDVLDQLTGSVGLTLSYTDEVVGARIINKYAKEDEALALGGGILEKKFILGDMVRRLANLPSKDQLLAKLVGSIKSPVTGFVGVLSANLRNLVGVLSAIKDKK